MASLSEQSKDNQENNENKMKCHSGNVVSLSEIVGDPEDFEDYTSTIRKRKSGVKALTDSLELMKNLHLHSGVKDGGAHLAYDLLEKLKPYQNKNFLYLQIYPF